MSLFFNMLSRFVIFFSFKEEVSFKLVAAVKVHSDFGAQVNKICHCFHLIPIIFPWSDGTKCHDLCFLNIKPVFSVSSFTLTERLFSSSLLSPLKVVLSVYLKLLVLIPACDSLSLAFHIMYCVQKLNKHGDNIQPWCIPFPIWNQSVVPCPVLTIASWTAYRFLRR